MQTDWFETAQDRKAWYGSCTANFESKKTQQITKEQDKGNRKETIIMIYLHNML